MLVSYNDLVQFSIDARDGQKGRADDFYFDDETWRIRYLVAGSGFLVNRRQGLVKSTLLGTPDLEAQTLPVALTRDELDDADTPDTAPPVSEQRRQRMRLMQFDRWPSFMLGIPGAVYTPHVAEQQLAEQTLAEDLSEPAAQVRGDPRLRSMAEVSGYRVGATDGEIGSVSDFLLDPDGWRIRYLAVDTGNWLPGRQVVIQPDWISSVSWADQSIFVDATKGKVEEAPELSQVSELERSNALVAIAPYGVYGIAPM